MYSELSSSNDFNFDALSIFRQPENIALVADSRQVKTGAVFMAYRGEYADGRDYIQQAILQGASSIIYESSDDFSFNSDIPAIGIPNLREHAGEVAAYLLDNPSQKVRTIGVTGTNGKTSITQWLAQALDALGEKCALIGTVGNGFWESLQKTTHTTPEAVTVQNLFRQFVFQGACAVSMEVSSHGLDQFRVNGVMFRTAIFTNLTRDHLDYHGDMEHYAQTKKRLFYWHDLAHAIINIDDDFGRSLAEELRQKRPQLRVITYGFSADADVCIKNFQAAFSGNICTFQTLWGQITIQNRLLGRFNAQNLAACVAALAVNGFEINKIAQVLAHIQPAKGRMDCIFNDKKPLIVIDYAHTPDALKNALITLQEMKSPSSRLWCVFGCGGNRDQGKRPMMGTIAQEYADAVVVTSDNPRFEEPEAIIDDILVSIRQPEYVNTNRSTAIEYAITHASADDIILIAGKGHEDYQEIQGIKHHFDDFEEAQKYLNS